MAEVEILQRMADASIPESDFDFDAMAEEIWIEAKKYAKAPFKKEENRCDSKIEFAFDLDRLDRRPSSQLWS
jgi:hypothetical protein